MTVHNHHEHRPGSFGEEMATSYDDNCRVMTPIYDNLHFLIRAVLDDLPKNATILSVGAGTGTEIIRLAGFFPEFTFVAVDPSREMLAVCRERLRAHGLLERCTLVHGHIEDVSQEVTFDAALCLLVLHHTPETVRQTIVKGIAGRLKPRGRFIVAELSYDDSTSQFGDLLDKWIAVLRITGTAEKKARALPALFKEHLSVLSPVAAENLLVANGFEQPVRFFQSLIMLAWFAQKRE